MAEETVPHTRMMKCTLEVEPSRAYWAEYGLIGVPVSKDHAFQRATFGSKTYMRVERLVADLRHRYDAFPPALEVLGHWHGMRPDDRVLICHWHTQLADPIYRRFTGELMVDRYHHGPRPTVDSEMVVRWLENQVPGRWQFATRSKIASKMMSSAFTAGLLASNRDPRTIRFPQVSDQALTYLVYLLREVSFAGTLIANPYLASVGLDSDTSCRRLRAIPAIGFRRQGDLIEFQWQHESLGQWAAAAGLLDNLGSRRGAG
ncbi:MAG: DUF1819 domain-containing protein [Planctomycetaceae bacterium]|nr:MAG: DUF1819 domain-containing protein [Planctomycetaceae bacterium]